MLTRVGTSIVSINAKAGAINGNLLYVGEGNGNVAPIDDPKTVVVVNTTTGAITSTFTLPSDLGVADWTFANGYAWAARPGSITRIDLLNAAHTVTRFPAAFLPPSASPYGAAWTFGNGNLGFSNNGTGTVSQVEVANPASASPTFTLIATSAGPASANNDGAASPSAPADMSIVKSGPATFNPGGTLTFTLAVTNNGPFASSGSVVNDTIPAGLTVQSASAGCTIAGNTVTCTNGPLAVKASKAITITASSALSTTACVTNTATVLGNEADTVTANNTSSATSCPHFLAITKTSDATTATRVGDTVHYTVTTTNNGPGAYTDADPAVVVDDLSGVLGNATYSNDAARVPATGTIGYAAPNITWSGPLAAGARVTITYSAVMTAGGDGNLRNVAYVPNDPKNPVTPACNPANADGLDPVTNEPCAATNSALPSLSLVKTVSPTSPTAAGQSVTYSFLITNTGDETLAPVTVAETAFSGTGTAPVITCPAGAASLAPDASVTCAAPYVLTQADVDAGVIDNTAVAIGQPPTGAAVDSPPADAVVTISKAPALTLTKSAAPNDTASFQVGQVITYSFVLANTGNVTLTNVHPIEGAFTGTGTLPDPVCPADAASLAPNTSVTCTAMYTVTQADVDAGSITNHATGTGTPPTTPDQIVTVPAEQTAGITVAKTATPSTASNVGDVITYAFLVENTGNVRLTNVTVTDDPAGFTGSGDLSAIHCPAEAASMAPGEDVTCTATYTLTQEDVDNGSVTNSATATGTPPGLLTPPVSPPSTAAVDIAPQPGLTVTKTADPAATKGKVGDTITYSFLVTNTGNMTLTDVSVADDPAAFTGTGTLGAITCPDNPNGAITLAPRANVVCTASYTLTQADVDNGSVSNTATATGTPPSGPPPVSPPDTVTVPGDQEPGITVLKSANPSTIGKVGDMVTYSFLMTNTGNVTLTDVHPVEGAFTGTGTPPAPACPAGTATLLPGQTVTCTATYQLTQADVGNGQIFNTAIATGTPPGGLVSPVSPPSTSTVTVAPAPQLTLVKSASLNDAAHFTVGQVITYSFVATNSGNTTLTDVTVNETAFTGAGGLGAITCPDQPNGSITLNPDQQVTCTASYTLQQEDVDNGSVSNTATATGTPPGNTPPPTSPPSTTEVPGDRHADLTVVKSADPQTTPGKVGDLITYSFLMANTGNVTLTEVHPVEGAFSGTGELSAITCPVAADRMLPGAQVTCTATYTLTQADVDNGQLTNTATATGTRPAMAPR